MFKDEKISRRGWLKGAAVVATAAGIAPLLSSRSPAAAKVAKSTVHYQDNPNHMRMCGMCKYFLSSGGGHSEMGPGMMRGDMMGRGMMKDSMMGGEMMQAGMMKGRMMGTGTCELVSGRISPMGYCDLYAPRSG